MAGDAEVRYGPGLLYEHGESVERDYCYAALRYRMAADAGHRMATYRLAAMYRGGRGVPRDQELAARIVGSLEDVGHEGAARTVREIDCLGRAYRPMFWCLWVAQWRVGSKRSSAGCVGYA